jgi:hypothetical protein
LQSTAIKNYVRFFNNFVPPKITEQKNNGKSGPNFGKKCKISIIGF